MTKIIAVFAFIATIGIANLSPLTASAAADTCTWTGITSANWATGTNWAGCDNSGVPENGDTLVFPQSGANKSMTNNIPGLTPDRIDITGTGYTFTGNTLTVASSSNFFVASQDANINLQVAFNGGNPSSSVSAGKVLTFNQPVAFGSSFAQYWEGGGTATFNGAITGSATGFYATNGTMLNINGASNTYTATTVGAESNAHFVCNSATCFGNSANNIYMGGGVVDITVTGTFNNGYTTSTTTADESRLTANDNVTITGTGDVIDNLSIEQKTTGKSLQFIGNSTLNGPASTQGSITVYGNNTTSNVKFDGSLSGAGNVTVNSGNAWMSSSNTFTGTITVKSGAVAKADQTNSLGSTAGSTIVESGGSLMLESTAPITITEPLQIAGEGVSPVSYKGAIYGSSASDDVTLTGNMTLTGDATIYNEAVGDTLSVSGVVSGAHNLTYNGADGAYIDVGGISPNTYTGTTYVTGATIYLKKTLAVPGNITLDANDPIGNNATVYNYATNTVADNAIVALTNSTDLFQLGESNTDEVIGGLVGPAGIVAFQSNTTNLTIDQDFNSTYGGNFYADGRSPDITKRGTGNLLLTGGLEWNLDNAIDFIVEEGTMTVNGNLASDNGGTDLFVTNTGTLKGTGTLGNLNATGGKIAAGNSPGTLHVTTLTMNSSTTFEQEIAGNLAGTEYDQLIASGAVNLGNAVLSIVPTYTPIANQTFTIITGSSLTGTFNGLANGATVKSKGITFRVNYNATTVTLTYVSGTYDPNASDTTLANTGTSMLLAGIASLMLIATATALTMRRRQGNATI